MKNLKKKFHFLKIDFQKVGRFVLVKKKTHSPFLASKKGNPIISQ
jgi:hypothetical protein